MGGKKDREYDTILKELQSIDTMLDELLKDAKYLTVSASAAESTLQDRVGKKNIEAIKGLANDIYRSVSVGQERIRELENRTKADQGRFEEL